MEKRCISCGMPLVAQEDYPLGDVSKEYCKYCAREDGSLKSFEEAVAGMSAFLQNTQGLDEKEATKAAIEALKQNPAWQD